MDYIQLIKGLIGGTAMDRSVNLMRFYQNVIIDVDDYEIQA